MLIKKTSTIGVLKNVYLKRTEPISLVHFLTNRCNARCSFCFIDFEDPNTFANELTLNEIEKLTKNLGSSLTQEQDWAAIFLGQIFFQLFLSLEGSMRVLVIWD